MAIKIIYFLFAILVSSYYKDIGISFTYQSYTNTIKKNDSYWYDKISREGYSKITNKRDLGFHDGIHYKQSEWAFFPMYPLLIRGTNFILSSDFNSSGIFWSVIFSILGFIGFYIWLKDSEKGFFYTLVLMCFPFHYYFSMLYTEAIFFTLLIFCFVSIRNKKFWQLSVLLIPLTLLRPNGIVVLIPLFLYFLEQQNILVKYKISLSKINKKFFVESLYFITAPLAFISYCIFAKQITGEYFAFTIAQTGWYKEYMFPLFAFFRRGDFMTQFFSYYTIIFIVIAIFSRKKFPLSMNILIWVLLVLPLCAGSVTSMPRFISLIFPFSIIIGSWIYKIRYRYLVLISLFSLQLITYYFWLVGDSLSF